ncbi:MAG: aminotransferase class III-fold pyridoxal phosphate-dependent enzyme [Candidatus Binatia bacterium]|jgi:glutamate-1-semialdehyde 2,1-aminomutase
MLKMEKNRELTEKFGRYYPASHSNYRVPIEATENRVFIVRAEGSHLWDVDGNEYIDYHCGMGPSILGHRHPEFVKGLKDLLDTSSVHIGSGLLFSPDDIEVAEKLVKHVPCAQQVKFCISGSEAVQMAIRLARGYTGRPYFIRFGGHYHGWFDNVLGGMVNPSPAGMPFAYYDPESNPYIDSCFTLGRAANTEKESFLLPWNDLAVLEDTLKKYGEQVAMIHFEALVCNHFCLPPRPGYLERIRELCTQYGIVMSMDEVITGFRLGLSGAQGYYGVTPDICTLGKCLAGGVPMSAVVGKADIMEQLRDKKVLGPGTFNGYPLGMRAALTTLKILERNNGAVYGEMERVQKRLEAGLKELAQKHGIQLRIQGGLGVFFLIFGADSDKVIYTDEDLMADLDLEKTLNFWSGMNLEGIGVMVGGRWYMSIAHTDADVEKTLQAADKVMGSL